MHTACLTAVSRSPVPDGPLGYFPPAEGRRLVGGPSQLTALGAHSQWVPRRCFGRGPPGIGLGLFWVVVGSVLVAPRATGTGAPRRDFPGGSSAGILVNDKHPKFHRP